MNQMQRIVIIAGTALVALCGIFPPYNGEWVREGNNFKTSVGYHLVFTPPSPREVADAFGNGTVEDMWLPCYHARIATDRTMLQIGTVILITIGAVFLFAERRHIPRK
jgi:hypothetical protein